MTIYIKTHGRPDKQYTYHTLREAGYTGHIVFVVDNEDLTADGLCSRYVNCDTMCDIEVFDKQYYVDKIDCGVATPKRNVNLYAWCACEDIACETHMIMADDDITEFRYRYNESGVLKSLRVTQNMDEIIDSIFDFIYSGNIAAASTGIPQMYFNTDLDKNLYKYRVPYNFVFRNRNYKIDWTGEFQEEIIMSINASNQGKYITALPILQHTIKPLGKESGGMYEAYHSDDSFKLSQYGHMWHPTAEHPKKYKGRWITTISRDNAFAKLISSCCKKV